MRTKHIYFLIFLSISLKLTAQETPNFEHYKLALSSKKVKPAEIIDHVEIIGLEETENSLISEATVFVELPQGLAVVDKYQKKIFIFNSKGGHISTISRQGNGPTYYSGVNSVWLKNNTIEVFSQDQRKLLRFDLNGEYLNEKKVSIDKTIRLGEMSMLDDGYVISTSENIFPNGRAKAAGYSLLILDQNLKVVDQKLKSNYVPPFPHGISSELIKEDNFILFKKKLKDTLYYVAKDRVTPYLHLDFNENWAWGSKDKKLTLNEAFSIMQKGTKVYELFPLISSKMIAIEYWINRKHREFGLLNRNTKEFSTLKESAEGLWFRARQWQGDRLVAFMQSYKLEAFLESLESSQWSVKGDYNLEEILSSENPVILKIKFKE